LNTWIYRGVGTIVLSAGLIAAGSTVAQASELPFGNFGSGVGQWGTNYAQQSNSILANPTQNGLVNVNVVAGNLQFNRADQSVDNTASPYGFPGVGNGFRSRMGRPY